VTLEKKNKVRIQSVDRILDILEELSSEKNGLTISELAKRVDLQVSTTYNLVNTLRTRDYIYQNEETKKYFIGLRILALKNSFLDHLDIRSIAIPHLEKFHAELPETIHLSIRKDLHVIPIFRLESTHAIKVDSAYVGNESPIYCTATGRALLSNYNEAELDKLLSRIELKALTEHTITDKQALVKEIMDIKHRGYSRDRMEFQPNVYCIGAPLLNHESKVVASFSVSMPSIRYSQKDEERIAAFVTHYAHAISDDLGMKYFN